MGFSVWVRAPDSKRKPETLQAKSKIRNLKSESRNPKPEISYPKSQTQSLETLPQDPTRNSKPVKPNPKDKTQTPKSPTSYPNIKPQTLNSKPFAKDKPSRGDARLSRAAERSRQQALTATMQEVRGSIPSGGGFAFCPFLRLQSGHVGVKFGSALGDKRQTEWTDLLPTVGWSKHI